MKALLMLVTLIALSARASEQPPLAKVPSTLKDLHQEPTDQEMFLEGIEVRLQNLERQLSARESAHNSPIEELRRLREEKTKTEARFRQLRKKPLENDERQSLEEAVSELEKGTGEKD